MWIRGMVACAALMALTACGGGRPAETVTSARAPAYSPGALAFARGPIATACRASDRNRATRAHCGCVQAVANQRLSASDQRRGAAFFKDPHQAQVIRQSDNASNEAFWQRWKAYGTAAAQICR